MKIDINNILKAIIEFTKGFNPCEKIIFLIIIAIIFIGYNSSSIEKGKEIVPETPSIVLNIESITIIGAENNIN